MRRLKDTRRRRRGSNAIEFGLLFPLFTTMLAAFIDFGWMYFQQSVLDTSISAGCRAGSLVDPGEEDEQILDVEGAVQTSTASAVASSGGGQCDACTITVDTSGATPGRSLVCRIERRVAPLTGLVMDPVVLSSGIVVRMEWQRE